MATEYLFANRAATTLAQSVSATATVLNLATGDGSLFPQPSTGQAFAITLEDAATQLENEICYCTARSGDQLTVTRGMEGTTAQAWTAGDRASNYITAGVMASWLQESDLNGIATQAWVRSNFITSASATSGTGDIRFSYAAWSGSVSAPYFAGTNSSGTATNYILATQDYLKSYFTGSGANASISNIQGINWSTGAVNSYVQVTGNGISLPVPTLNYVSNVYATISGLNTVSQGLSETNNVLNQGFDNLNTAIDQTNLQVKVLNSSITNLGNSKVSTSTQTTGSGNLKVANMFAASSDGTVYIQYYNSSGTLVTKKLTTS